MNTKTAPFFTNQSVTTSRIIYTPSSFARFNLVHLQETGTLTAKSPHVSKRSGLQSYLFFIVISGSGVLSYDNKNYVLHTGDCVFIDCRKPYKQCSSADLWTLSWVHFYGPNLSSIYGKYIERGGRATFRTCHYDEFIALLNDIFVIASSSSYIRDMEIAEKLMSLLTILMDESWNPDNKLKNSLNQHKQNGNRKVDVNAVKEYLDQHFVEKIALEELAKRFYINKFYMTKVFKEQCGTTISNYVLQLRITKAKELLRFSNMNVESVGMECGFLDANYFTRAFKKIEGVTPGQYRRSW